MTVQEDEERPPPPPPEEQSTSDSRDPRTANRNPTLELAESIVDSVLGPCTSEATIRLSNTYIILKIIKILREHLKCYYIHKDTLKFSELIVLCRKLNASDCKLKLGFFAL